MGDMGQSKGTSWTHIGVFGIDTSNEVSKTMFFLILVRDKNGLSLKIAMMDLEASFVGNPVSISEGRSTRKVIAGHIMESTEAERLRENE